MNWRACACDWRVGNVWHDDGCTRQEQPSRGVVDTLKLYSKGVKPLA